MSQGVVTEYLVSLIARQIEASPLVVWYDLGGDYRALTECIEVPGASIYKIRAIADFVNAPTSVCAPILVVAVNVERT
jgi:hypothetical protein